MAEHVGYDANTDTDLRDLVTEMRLQLAEQARQIADLTAALVTPGPPTGSPPSVAAPNPPSGDRAVTRRRLLLGGAGVAAAGAVAMVSSASPAAAINGNLVLGSNGNSTNAPTGVSAAGGTYGFGVTDGGYAGSLATDKPAIFGQSFGTTFITGVLGLYTGGSVAGTGVTGRSNPGSGVKGVSTSGAGVDGSSSTGFGVYGTSTNTGVGGTGDGYGVTGITSGGEGVFGRANDGTGVHGQSLSTGIGVNGSSDTGVGVLGSSNLGAGVRGNANGFYAGVEGHNTYANGGAGAGVYGVANNAEGVLGETNASGKAAVRGSSLNLSGIGVKGFSYGGTAIIAETVDGFGLDVSSTTGIAVQATTDTGKGVYASSVNNLAGELVSDHAQLHLSPATFDTRPAPTGDSFGHFKGELFVDGIGDLWYCATTGTPGEWRRVSGTKTAGALVILPAPARVYDSRVGTAPSVPPKIPLAANTARTLDVTVNNSGVPVGARGAMVSLLVVGANPGNGNFTIWADGVARPLANNMVWGGTVGRFSSLAVTALSATAKCQILSSIKTDFVLDVIGYYR